VHLVGFLYANDLIVLLILRGTLSWQ